MISDTTLKSDDGSLLLTGSKTLDNLLKNRGCECLYKYEVKNNIYREITEQLRELTALAEDLEDSVPSTDIRQLTTDSNNSSKGSDAFFGCQTHIGHTCFMYIFTHITRTYTKIKINESSHTTKHKA